jgi:hypothetical protein
MVRRRSRWQRPSRTYLTICSDARTHTRQGRAVTRILLGEPGGSEFHDTERPTDGAPAARPALMAAEGREQEQKEPRRNHDAENQQNDRQRHYRSFGLSVRRRNSGHGHRGYAAARNIDIDDLPTPSRVSPRRSEQRSSPMIPSGKQTGRFVPISAAVGRPCSDTSSSSRWRCRGRSNCTPHSRQRVRPSPPPCARASARSLATRPGSVSCTISESFIVKR